jgi:hypothetical protein
MQSIVNSVLFRIRGNGRGWVFSPTDFIDLAELRTVNVVLGRLTKAGKIRRLSRGIYDYPRLHSKLGTLFPEINSVVKAIIGRDKIRLQPAGAYAANMLGLSEQVPSKVVFLTDGKSKKITIGKLSIEFKKTSTKNMALAGKEAGLVIEAFRYMTEQYITENMIKRLNKVLSPTSKKDLMKNLRVAPAWMIPFIKKIAGVK